MNCFEARQEFPAFWRNTLGEQACAALAEHLRTCARCDHAFRVFALTAPVLHSESEGPLAHAHESRREFSLADRPRRFVPVPEEAEPRRWFAMCAAVTVVAAASFAAYLSVTAPIDSLSEELSGSGAEATETMDLFNEPAFEIADLAN